MPTEWRCVERWWNGIVHQQRCRDIWLSTDGRRWKLQARQGEAGELWEHTFDDEPAARTELEAMKRRAAPAWTAMHPVPPRHR